MKNDWLMYVLCLLLICVGGVFGHSLAVSEMGFFDFVIGGGSGWIQFALGLLVSFIFYKLSGAQAEKHEAGIDMVLRHQELKGQGTDVGVVRDANGKAIGLRQSHAITEELAATGGVDRIVMTRTTLKGEA